MQQTVIKVGNSSGIILSQSIRQQTGLMPGDKVNVDAKGNDIIISPIKKKKSGEVDAKFMKMVDEFITEHSDVLEELAKR